jgi:hypothetical protein
MKIYANGCSFTFGDELTNPSISAWPQVLAKMLNGDITNDAISGGTNQRTVYHTIKNSENNYDLYLIAWASNTRFTFYKSDNNFEINFNPSLRNSLYGSESFFKDWGRVLYDTWYNELYAFKLWLQQIIQLQAFLSDKKYLMINTSENNLSRWTTERGTFINKVTPLINLDCMSDEQILDEYNEIQYYLRLIDTNKFYNWNSFCINNLCNDFPIGSRGHILEEGHRHLAELLYNHICLNLKT